MITRALILAYGAGGYLVAQATLLYVMGFLAGAIVPKAINDGTPGPLGASIAIDLGLIALFGLHHSGAARRWFKAALAKIVSPAIERASYLYMTAGVTALLVIFWQPIPTTLWRVEDAVFVYPINAAYLCAWAMMLAATFHFGHFGFFGLRQSWEHFKRQQAAAPTFTARYLYALIRHPISLGWMLTPWLTPHMTLGQLIFALGAAIYVLAATPFEEADLIEEVGNDYVDYRKRVPAFLPNPLRRRV